jgi:hypothetical protein
MKATQNWINIGQVGKEASSMILWQPGSSGVRKRPTSSSDTSAQGRPARQDDPHDSEIPIKPGDALKNFHGILTGLSRKRISHFFIASILVFPTWRQQ